MTSSQETATPPTSLWTTSATDKTAVGRLAEYLGCPPAMAHLLTVRGISSREAADAFFDASLSRLHDPGLMLGMETAVRRIRQAVEAEEPILIYGDYDVDGTTATVLLKTAIERIAPPGRPARVSFHVPHRIREGYGMQTNVLALAADVGIRLVISVDTGIRAFAAAEEARSLGLDLIVTDHHLPDGASGVPDALAVLNPCQPGCPYPYKSLCGAAVAFKLAHALLSASVSTPEQQHRLQTVLLPSFLKLVAIATIADSVPLTGENRTIAALGLAELRNPVQPGLRALMQVAKLPLDQSPTAMEVAFRIAPRINAAGRMDVADDVIELFLTRDPDRAQELAEKLDRLNQERRAVEAEALREIEQRLLSLRDDDGNLPADCIIVDDPGWHRGVLGILASRIVERTFRPALVLSHEGEDAHGSGRSVPGFHLLDALTEVHQSRNDPDALFHRFGGHSHAVGFSLPLAQLPHLRSRMSRYAQSTLSCELLCPSFEYHAELRLSEIDSGLWNWIERCAPFGNANPEPVFLTRGASLAAPVRLIKEVHICLELEQGSTRLSALGWSRTTDWVARTTQLQPKSSIDLLYRIRRNQHPLYGGFELELVDLRLTEPADHVH